MDDIVALQQAIFHGLRSCRAFDPLNIVLAREFLLQSEVELSAIWQTPRNEFQGCGLIVQMPTLRFPKPNGQQRERHFTVTIYEERNTNFTPNIGTMTTAEDWADLVLDFLLNWRLTRSSGLIPSDNAIRPDERFKNEGALGQTVDMMLRQERAPKARAATPVIDVSNPNAVTITVSDGSQIYYTTDGFSFPGPSNEGKLVDEEAALFYAAPFAADSGSIIMAVAYSDDKLPSQLVDFQIP